jgi:hypothetical protein
MRRLLAGRSTPAIAVGIVGLLIAGGGYAIASSGGTINACIHKGSGTLYIKSRCQKKDKRISWNLVGPKGASGLRGGAGAAGATGATGAIGPKGEQGPAGTAVGYADIAAGGSIQVNTTPFNVSAANVSHVATGEYCFVNLPFTPHSAMVSADNSFTANTTIVSVLTFNPGVVPSCPVRVRTFNDSGGALAATDEPFNIWFQ